MMVLECELVAVHIPIHTPHWSADEHELGTDNCFEPLTPTQDL